MLEKRRTANDALVTLVEGGIIAAICLVLEFIPHEVGVSSIQLSYGLIPLTLYAVRRGYGPAILVGLVWGILDWIKGGAVSYGVPQVILDYPLAFMLAGFVGIFAKQIQAQIKARHQQKAYFYLLVSFLIGTGLKYLSHYVSGVWFFGQYAPKGINAYMWSLIVNGGSVIANLVLGAVILFVLVKAYPKLFIARQ